MSKNKQRLWLFYMLLIYIGIALSGFAVAYFIKTNFFPSVQTAVQPTPIVAKITPIPTPFGWKTYTNTNYLVRFSYPPQDSIQSSSMGFGVTKLEIKNSSASGTTDFQILLLPKSLAQTVGQDFDSYYAMPDKTTKAIQSPFAKDNTTEKFTKIDNRSVDGNQAIDYQAVASNAKAGTQPEIGTLITVGDNLVVISTEKKNKEALDQLLSTFTYSP